MLNFDLKRLEDSLREVRELDFKQIANKLNVKQTEHTNLGSWLNQLLIKGRIYLSATTKKYSLTEMVGTISGQIRVNEKNFAFVSPEGERERDKAIFIGPKHFNGALNEDTVLIDVYKACNQEAKLFGIVKEVIKRATSRLVLITTYSEWLERKVLKPLDPRLKGNFQLDNINELALGEVIVARIRDFNRGVFLLEKIKSVGDLKEGNNDINALLEHYRVDATFSEEVLDEIKQLRSDLDSEEIKGREDLRELLIFTIDGETTKDFDDAISIVVDDNGDYVLGVHIADVSHYVKEGTALDREAAKRATSIYYLDQTIPMLPLKLSADLCSLVPNQDRLTITVEMRVNKRGELLESKVYPSLIRSRYRLTYKQVNSFLAGKRNATASLASALNNLADVATLIRERRVEKGYVDLDISESIINLAEDGSVRSIKRKHRGASELIVEDLMVKANETVAGLLKDNGLPGIYRNHPKPSKERFEYLKMLVSYLKLDDKIELDDENNPLQFSRIVNKIKQEDLLTNFTRSALLRSLERAVYSTTDSDHFGLASPSYLHFTSPIRRYPDLIVHRILREILIKEIKGEARKRKIEALTSNLVEIAVNSSSQERMAAELEQDVQSLKRARYYRERIGKSYLAEIIAIERNLICCELEDKTVAYLRLNQFNTTFETSSFEAKSSDNLHFKAGENIWVTVVEVENDSFSGKIILDFKGESIKRRKRSPIY